MQMKLQTKHPSDSYFQASIVLWPVSLETIDPKHHKRVLKLSFYANFSKAYKQKKADPSMQRTFGRDNKSAQLTTRSPVTSPEARPQIFQEAKINMSDHV